MRNSLRYSVRFTFQGLLMMQALLGLLLLNGRVAQADAVGERRRAQLAPVKRIVVMPPFFGTETLTIVKPPPKPNTKESPQLVQYRDYLKQIEKHLKEWLPERVHVRTPFEVIPSEEISEALKALQLTPENLFQNNGKMHGSRFALPDPVNVKRVADRLHADAVLLGTLDEPRRSNGKYTFDVLEGIGYDSPNVRCKAGYYLLLADGTQVLFNPIEVLHPLTKLGSREFLLADWLETEEQAFENFMDELTRYTPAPKRPAP